MEEPKEEKDPTTWIVILIVCMGFTIYMMMTLVRTSLLLKEGTASLGKITSISYNEGGSDITVETQGKTITGSTGLLPNPPSSPFQVGADIEVTCTKERCELSHPYFFRMTLTLLFIFLGGILYSFSQLFETRQFYKDAASFFVVAATFCLGWALWSLYAVIA